MKLRTLTLPYKGLSESGELKIRYRVDYDKTASEMDERWEWDIESIKFIDSDGKPSTELYNFLQNCDLMENSLDKIKDKIDEECYKEWLELKEPSDDYDETKVWEQLN